MIDQTKTMVVGTDGRVRDVPAYLVPDLIKQGFKVFNSPPKENYFPSLDQTIERGRATGTNPFPAEETDDVLYVEQV